MEVELRKEYFKELQKEIKELVDSDTGLLDTKYSSVIDCPLCGCEPSFHKKLIVKNGYTFVRCETCEMIFTNPRVNEEILGELLIKVQPGQEAGKFIVVFLYDTL